MKKVLCFLVFLAVLALLGWHVYLRVSAEREDGPRQRAGGRAVAVALEPVRRETIRDVAEFTGTLLPQSRFVVAPKISGRLEQLSVNIGDFVSNGDLIAVLDSEEYSQQVAQAEAELQVGRANLAESRSALDVAAREFERAKELRAQKVASEAELDQAEARYRAAAAKHQVAEAQIKQREAALRTVQVRLSYTRIHAVWEDPGNARRVIAERFVDEGAMLRANDPIVSVVDLGAVLAVIHVIERDFPGIEVGQPARISTDAYPQREFEGTIVRRAPVLKEESRQARVEVEITNAEGLLAPGMFVRARIQFAEHPDATVVPVSAMVRRNGEQGVFVADLAEAKARFVPVRVGIVNGAAAEILDPPLEGQVITLGQHLLENGAAVILPQGAGRGAEKGSAPDARPVREGRP